MTSVPLLQLFGICTTSSLLLLVTEHMEGGTLGSNLASSEFRWQQRWGAAPRHIRDANSALIISAILSHVALCG